MFEKLDPLYVLLEQMLCQKKVSIEKICTDLFWSHLAASDEIEAKRIANVLLDLYPPWEGEEIILPMQRLGCFWALGIVANAHPNLTSKDDVPYVARRSMRLAAYLDAELCHREAFGHRIPLISTLRDRLAAWSLAVHAARDLTLKEPVPTLSGILVERLVIAETFCGSLIWSFINQLLRRATKRERTSVRAKVRQITTQALCNPWVPDGSLGSELRSALSTAGELEMVALLQRVKSSRVIEAGQGRPQFVAGLSENRNFVSASHRLDSRLPSR